MNKQFEVIAPVTISKDLYETNDRENFFKTDYFMNSFSSSVESIYNLGLKPIISCDVFDTVLFRNEKCEPFRFFEIATALKMKLNLPHNVYEILNARYLGVEITYSASKVLQGCREGSLYDIHRVMLNVLNVKPELLKKSIEVESEYERENLSLNDGLWNLLLNLKQLYNAEIIFISDMYKHSEQIEVLLNAHITNYHNIVYKLYSSADSVISKHSGKIFDFVEKDLNYHQEQFIHIGDNLRSDYQNPKKHGWNAIYLPVPKYIQEKIYENLISYKNQLDSNNIRIDLVDRYFTSEN